MGIGDRVHVGDGVGGNAFGADLTRMPVKAAPAPAAAPSWTGFYLGAHAGYTWGSSDGDYTGIIPVPPPPPAPPMVFYPFGLNPEGATLGAHLGYNLQIGQWVVGLEGDWSWVIDASDRIYDPGGSGRYDEIDLFWTARARGRVGYLVTGNTLVFFAGGAAFASTRNTHYASDSGTLYDDSLVRTGYTLGGGIEGMFDPNWFMRIEYIFDKFENEYFGWTPTRYTNSDLTLNTVQFGISYRPAP